MARVRNYERENAQRRERYAADAEYRVHRLEQNKEWAERVGYDPGPRDPEKQREYSARYWARQPITKNEYNRQYKVAPEVKKMHNQRRRARRRGAHSEPVYGLVLLELADGACGICGEDVDPFDFHVDHIVALGRGGHHNYENTQIAHPACNLRKGTRFVPPVQERN